MTTSMQTTTRAGARAMLSPILAMAVIGLTLIFTIGHAGSDTLHGATHDTRHATGFPCH